MSESKLTALSEIVLPPGSTSDDLQSEINAATSAVTIIISSDMVFTGTVSILEEKEITLQSSPDSLWIMRSPGSKIRHFTLRGTLILQNITIDGGDIGGGVAITNGNLTMNEGAVIQYCYSGVSGGGITINNGGLTMNEGAVIQNCFSSAQGGGAYANPNGTISVNGGIFKENTSAAAGGGIMFQASTFTMTSGEFIGNTASASGGAIQMLGNNTLTMTGGIISGNTSGFQGGGIGVPTGTNANIANVIIIENKAKYNGGGLYVQGTAVMSDVTLCWNSADVLGGGIYVLAGGSLAITGESYIINNYAPNGGGIHKIYNNYNDLVTGSETVFRCNWASAAYQPPSDAGTLYPDIQFAETSITDHPLNNFDINYNTGEPIEVLVSLSYNANGGEGDYTGPDMIPGGTDTVLSPSQTGISRSEYLFLSWNTEADGSGEAYVPGVEITLGCSLVLYAQWAYDPPLSVVNYSANGGTGSYTDTPLLYNDYVILSAEQAGINRPGFLFIGWNTKADGSGTAYVPGDRIAVSENIDLYAQWRQFQQQQGPCRKPVTKCRMSIEGQITWIDNDNAGNTRPPTVAIILLRDGNFYKSAEMSATGDGYFCFCCLPKGKNASHTYNYQLDETPPDGYTRTILGYNVVNTLNP